MSLSTPAPLPRNPLEHLATALISGKVRPSAMLLQRQPARAVAQIYIWLPAQSPYFTRVNARTLASMYAAFPYHSGARSFAQALGQSCDQGVERRFLAMLEADADTRPERLLALVRLAKVRALQPFNYEQLANDLNTLGLRGTQERWAADFYINRRQP